MFSTLLLSLLLSVAGSPDVTLVAQEDSVLKEEPTCKAWCSDWVSDDPNLDGDPSIVPPKCYVSSSDGARIYDHDWDVLNLFLKKHCRPLPEV